MQRCRRHGGPAEGQQGVPARVCHARVQVPAALLADQWHGHQRSSVSKPAPRTEAWRSPSRTWRARGSWTADKELADTSPSGVSSVQQAWAPREHAGHLGSSLQSCQAPPPGRRPGHQPTWPPWLGTRMGKLQGGQLGGCLRPLAKTPEPLPQGSPRGVPTGPLNQEKQRKLKSEDSRRVQPTPVA